jgi:hypothetical protein
VGNTKERLPAQRRVGSAAGDVLEGVLPFRRREIGIAAIGRRVHRLRHLAKHKAGRASAKLMRSDGVPLVLIFSDRFMKFPILQKIANETNILV